jgi:asparagine synthase (glutamine-hydrolysing)
MCGVAGIFNLDGQPASVALLEAMTASLVHRGPDGEGIYTQGPIGLGHRRLAVIDLSSAGNQPMESADGRFVISYNGEVFNFRELRTELERLGHRFRSKSDTEVVLLAWAQWGVAALERLNGMFAFAVWDTVTQELVLARDRYGIKPFYYARVGETLLFGSEAKAILTHPRYRRQLDREALLEYLTFQNLLTQRTLFAGISLLPAGSLLRVRCGRFPQLEPEVYWDFDFREPTEAVDEWECLEELDRLFGQAVRRQLVADVPVAAYLSGGMDSGSIAAIAAAEIPHMRTFTVGFDLSSAEAAELGFDERSLAERMSHHCKTEHYEMVLKAGDMERAMAQLVWHLEEPRVGQSYPNYYAAQLAGKFGKVVLSGAGGDELFGGYPWRYYRATVNDDFDHYVDKYYLYWQRLINNRTLQAMLKPIWSEVGHVRTRDIFHDVFAQHSSELTRPEDYISHSLYFEAKTFLHGLLVVEDKLSMAHSLETRLPFLDNDLVDFAMRIPVALKLGNLGEVVRLNENEPGPKTKRYFAKTRDGKLILRRVMERHIPAKIAQAEKQGFSAPDASWFRKESAAYVRRRLLGSDAMIYDYLDPDTVRHLVEEHLDGRENRRLLIWSLLSIEQWCQTFLDDERLGAEDFTDRADGGAAQSVKLAKIAGERGTK